MKSGNAQNTAARFARSYVILSGAQRKEGSGLRSGHALRMPSAPSHHIPDPVRLPLRAGSSASPQDDSRIKAFTLIELLVVISVIVLLMALLLPALSRAKKPAQAVVCQARLRQLGQLAAIGAHEDRPRKRTLPDGGKTWSDALEVWHLLTDPEHPELPVCPSATRLLPEASPWVRGVWGDTFHAFLLYTGRQGGSKASYGCNAWTNIYGDWGGSKRRRWHRRDKRGPSNIPVLFDCATPSVLPYHSCPPRELEHILFVGGVFSDIIPDENVTTMSPVCINRHNGGVNMLFMDWSVRKVGLKELWTLKWHKDFDRSGPWTKAGGVLPEDWPEWMRQFKDY